MTRREKERRIRGIVSKLVPILGLESWRIELRFYGTKSEMGRETDEALSAGCHAEPEYKNAVIVFALDEFKPEELPELVLHELLHIPIFELTAVLDRWANAKKERIETNRVATERVTNHMTYVVGKLLDIPVCGIFSTRSSSSD